MKLIIRVDAGTTIGTGHLMRCLALAEAWKKHGGQAVFITVCESDILLKRLRKEDFKVIRLEKPYPDPHDWKITSQELKLNPSAWIVLDGYHFDDSYQLRIKEMGHRLMVIDDMAHFEHYYADIILNQNINAEKLEYKCEPSTKLLLGTSHVLLRQEFWPWKDWQRQIPKVAKNILVTLGGSDPDNVTLKVIHALEKVEVGKLEVTVIVGDSYPYYDLLKTTAIESRLSIRLKQNTRHIPELMAWADLAVSAGGSTCWELAYMGVPTNTIILAENQVSVAEGLSKVGAAYNFGWYNLLNETHIAKVLTEHMFSYDIRFSFINCGKSLIDGNGIKRVSRLLSKDRLFLRAANINDRYLIWKWANDPVTRAQSFTSEYIPWEHHKLWFESNLSNSNLFIYIAINESDLAIGLIRYQKKGKDAIVSITVAPEQRGKGYGSAIIELGTHEMLRVSDVDAIHAYLKPNNKASRRAFVEAGFYLNDEVLIKDQPALHFVLRSNFKHV